MILPPKNEIQVRGNVRGVWHRTFAGYQYTVNMWFMLPLTALTGLIAGMVGISGGSFKVPLMVLACGVPMRVAVGTSSAMVAVTAFMGFLGHTFGGDFVPSLALPLAGAAVVGGLFGSRYAVKTKPRLLKMLFATTTFVAALFMVASIFLPIGG